MVLGQCYQVSTAIPLEDLKKARKNLDWLIEDMEHEN